MRKVDELFRSIDPAQNPVDEPDEALLGRIMALPRATTVTRGEIRGMSRRKWLLAGTAVVTAAAIGFVASDMFGTTAQPAYAVTPRPLKYTSTEQPASGVLEEIAARTEKLAPDTPAGGSQQFVQDSWSLSTRIDGIQVTSAVIPERRTTWKKPDGSEKWTVQTQKPQFQSDKQREVWKDAGSVGATPEKYSDSSGPADMSDERNHEAPTDPRAMRRWLALGYETQGPGETFDSVSERLLDRSFSPEQRAALLRALKNVPGIDYRGKTKDRAGRTGDAFSVTSAYGGLPKLQTLVFDPEDGSLLSYEEELVSNAGKLNVKTPAVTLYVSYLIDA
ncbi:CU044_5270 family protein [Streptomyces mirabilis]|uniref:CU044_5270 family protein n=1 Tax=Streptomyces mirabilis TaxID=68239 RepID=UPI00339E8F9C